MGHASWRSSSTKLQGPWCAVVGAVPGQQWGLQASFPLVVAATAGTGKEQAEPGPRPCSTEP